MTNNKRQPEKYGVGWPPSDILFLDIFIGNILRMPEVGVKTLSNRIMRNDIGYFSIHPLADNSFDAKINQTVGFYSTANYERHEESYPQNFIAFIPPKKLQGGDNAGNRS